MVFETDRLLRPPQTDNRGLRLIGFTHFFIMNIKSLINIAERSFVESIKRNLEEELKGHTEYDIDLNLDISYIQIKAQIQLCKKLLGQNK